MNILSIQKNNQEVKYRQSQFINTSLLLDFPTDKPRRRINTDNFKVNTNYQYISLIIGNNLTEALSEIATHQEASLSSLLLTAFQILLYRYTNQENIIIGCIKDYGKKSQAKLDILPLEVTIEEQQKFINVLEVTQDIITDDKSYSSEKISSLTASLTKKQELVPEDNLLQMLFKFEDLATSSSRLEKNTPRRELYLNIVKQEQQLVGQLEYNSGLYNAETVERIANNYQVLLESIVANSQTLISSLSLLSAQEKDQVLFKGNQTEVESKPQCIHQLFEAWANHNPEAIAIICGEKQLTYGELNQQANQLAHYLQAKKVAPGSLVGLCIERSPYMVIALLAILKLGAAYVPLDINNPPARIAFILEDAQIEVLVTESSLLDKLPPDIEQIICCDHQEDAIAKYDSDNLNLKIAINDLAHIVYTSGSTGKPKGVMLSHGNLSHYAQSLQLALDITPEDVYLHRGSIALIVSARQLLMPLAQGATAVIVTKQETKDPLELFALIKRHGVTIVDHVPSFWRNFWGILNQLDTERRNTLLDNQVRLVAAGGEQVTPEIYQCWRKIFKPNVKLANIYGQTEGTGVVTLYQIPDKIDSLFKSLPVGVPIPNMRVYLLDSNLQPVPIGVAAEIHISGAGVAQGYLNRPELTAEKFVANPYVSGERIYKTGDLGRILPARNGSIQFLGRVDRQVNIQGLRIELGEIEAVLSQNELVVEAAVIVGENKLREILCAYIVPNSTQQPTVEMLRSYLGEKLPPYMIPNTFLFVDEFPLTTSGKVDRRALAELTIEETTSIIAPRDRLEAKIVKIVQDILGIGAVSIRDNFIELGGNSLLAARLVTEIENRYAKKIPISRVFQASTPEALALLIRQDDGNNLPKSCVPLKSGNSKPTIFAIHNLGYGLEFYLPLAQYLDKDTSLYGLSSSFSDEPDKPHFRDVIGSAKYYVRELQQIQPQGPYHLLGVSFGGLIAYEMAQQLTSQGHEVNFLGLLDTYYPDQNATYKPSLQKRLTGHLRKIQNEGISHILKRIQWRFGATQDYLRFIVYKNDWIRNNFADPTSRNFAQTQYIEQKKEQKNLNEDYAIQAYPGIINMFRAANDIDTKLDWEKLALSGLFIHDVPGEHLEILQDPNAQTLAEKIQLALNIEH